MAQAQHGGYRKPANPAAVSGPGAMSQRTDGGPGQPIRDPGGLPYGENSDLRTQQKGATMSGSSPQASGAGMAALLSQTTTPISAPTQYPDEPLTAGQPFGPGSGPEVLATAGAMDAPTRKTLMASLPILIRRAESPDASPEFRAIVRYLRSTL